MAQTKLLSDDIFLLPLPIWETNMNIYVGNLSFDATDDELRGLFAAFGEVDAVNIIMDKYSGQSKGFGFVEMREKADGEKAVQELNGSELQGRAIKVNEARPREDRGGERGRGGGGGRGRGGGSGGGGGGGNRW